jgi:glycerol-3-phosphate acyltransferase PlsY
MELEAVGRAVLLAAAAYLIGSIPWGVIIARLTGGPDPRSLGSGRTGGANVMRALGPRWALVSGLLDAAKGTVAVLLARVVGAGIEVELLVALAAIVGHSRSIFVGFGGGRGIAPGWGGLLVLQPIVAVAVLPVFGGVIVATRYSSLGSLTGSATAGLLIAGLVLAGQLPPIYLAYAVAGPALIWYFHADNIGRLLRGEERKIGRVGGDRI